MTRCLRIFGAYTFRLSRRHSTVILLTSLILTITIILRLYTSRHTDHQNYQTKIGDFDYRPGVFLRGILPNESNSYCHFQYGLPDKIDWDSITTYPSPELGAKGPYKVIYDAIKATAYSNHTRYNAVTYATQATPEFVYHIVEIARYWDGPISLSVFVPNYELDITMQIMRHLCQCYDGMSKVSLHLFYPIQIPPKIRTKEELFYVIPEVVTQATNISAEDMLKKKLENYRNLDKLDNKSRAEYILQVRQSKAKRMMMRLQENKQLAPNINFVDCSGPNDFNIVTYRKDNNMFYPINVGRNVARNASKTNYFIVSDIEMVPSEGLARKFLTMVRELMGVKKREEGCVFAKSVFVVPLFEVERGEDIPRDKDTLVRMIAAKRASYFHQKTCAHCQRFPAMQSWILRPSPEGLEPLVISKREYPYHRWEPLFFGTHKEPWYNEILSWEGRQDKMLQMLEMCLQDYRLMVVDGGFLCHAAVTHIPSISARAMRINKKNYGKILSRLKNKYGDKSRCKLK